MNLTVATLPWGLILGRLHAFDRLETSSRFALLHRVWQNTDFTKPQDKVLRSQDWISGPRFDARPNPAAMACIQLVSLAAKGEEYLEQQPTGEKYRALLGDPAGTAMGQRLTALHGLVAQRVPLAPNLRLRVELAEKALSWDWTGIPIQEFQGPQQRQIRERGQALLAWISGQSTPPTLSQAVTHLDLANPLAQRALAWLIQTMVLFLRFDDKTGMVLLGLHPNLQASGGSTLPPAEPGLPEPRGSNAFFEDLAAILVAACEFPLAVRQAGGLTVKCTKLLVERLGPSDYPAELSSFSLEQRTLVAVNSLLDVEYLQPRQAALVPTQEGLAWLALTSFERRRPLAEAVREVRKFGTLFGLKHQIWSRIISHYLDSPTLVQEQLAVFGELGSQPRLLKTWREYCEIRLLPVGKESLRYFYQQGIDRLLANVMIPGDLVRLQDGVIALSPAGVWAFGLTDVWPGEALPKSAPELRPLIVQADFTLIFLSHSTAIEALVAGFSERVPGATGTGILYRLTKASIRRAAVGGLETASLLKMLREVSSKPIPANVEREITGWAGGIKKATAQTYQVVTLPDEASADLLMGLARPKEKAVRLAPLLVGLDPDARLTRLIAKAKAKALIIEAITTEDDEDHDDEDDDDDFPL